jgi:hypothetical protein
MRVEPTAHLSAGLKLLFLKSAAGYFRAHACSEIGQKWSKFGFRILDWEPHNKNSEIRAIEDDSHSSRRTKTIFSQFTHVKCMQLSY